MTDSLAAALALGAVTIGSVHALAPDHWIPIAAVARARGWSAGRTARVTLLCGTGHVTVSVLLGLLALVFGVGLIEAVGRRMESLGWLLLVGFGTAYTLWGMRHALASRFHGHHHDRYDHVHAPARGTTWSLFAIYCADPCVAVVPIVFAAAPLPAWHIAAIVALFEVVTMGTMVAMVSLARAGSAALGGRWIGRYGDAVAGGLIVATGLAIAVA